MANEGYHEPFERLSDATKDMHRAITSLMEELEAVDWYSQRVDAATDPALAAILRHHADEEKEHAAMLVEWIRRRDPTFDAVLREFLFKDGDIIAAERAAMGRAEPAGGVAPASAPASAPGAAAADADAGRRPTIGSLRTPMKGDPMGRGR